MKSIAFVMSDWGACGLYRCIMPSVWLNKTGTAKAYGTYHLALRGQLIEDYDMYFGQGLANQSRMMSDYAPPRDRIQQEFRDIETVIYQRAENKNTLWHLNLMKAAGKKTYLEYDDMVEGSHIARIRKAWEQMTSDFRALAAAADGIIVTTDVLAQYYRQYNDNIVVIPNSIDTSMWESKQSDAAIGYAGSSTHIREFKHLGLMLSRLAKKYPLRFMGFNPEGISCDYIGDSNLKDYPKKLPGAFSVGLAPLVRSKFNEGKSAIKWYEYSLAGIATVAEDYAPYKCIKDGVDGYRCNPGEWQDRIEYLMEHPDKKDELVLNAQNRIKEDYEISKYAHRWAEL